MPLLFLNIGGEIGDGIYHDIQKKIIRNRRHLVFVQRSSTSFLSRLYINMDPFLYMPMLIKPILSRLVEKTA